MWCWERQTHACSLPTPAQPHKNGPRAWNISLSRDKEPTPVPALSLCAGISFPASSSMRISSFISGSMAHSPSSEEVSTSFYCNTRGVHIGQLPWVSCQGHPVAMRDWRRLLELILFSLPYVSKSLVPSSVQPFVSSLVTPISRHSEQKRLDFCPWCLALWWSLLSSTRLVPLALVTAARCSAQHV